MLSRGLMFGWSPIITLVIIAGVGIDRHSMPKPADASEYHAAVRIAAQRIPMHIGNWIGQDVAVPHAAIRMLSPNVLISRRYVNAANGQTASFLLVQCGDARDIVAHYPPVCMVNAGWTLARAAPRDWSVNGRVVGGTEYCFSMSSFERTTALAIYNFMILPDGRIERNMDAVNGAAAAVARRYFGAAQVQVVMPEELPAAMRDQAFAELIGGVMETVETIERGTGK
jgi:hypothetical protein